MPNLDDRESEWYATPEQWRRLSERAREMRSSMTRAEGILWERLRGGRLGARFRRQHVLGPFVVDFYCASARLIVEVDGSVHDDTTERDHERDTYLRSRGFEIMRVANAEVMGHIERALEAIRLRL